MRYRARFYAGKEHALKMLEAMPSERGDNYARFYSLAESSARTYTRVQSDKFQISQTAGMGGTVVGSGTVSDETNGTIINVAFSFGVLPNNAAPISVLVCLGLAVYAVYSQLPYLVGGAVLGVLFSALYYWNRIVDMQFLLSELSEALGGLEWSRS